MYVNDVLDHVVLESVAVGDGQNYLKRVKYSEYFMISGTSFTNIANPCVVNLVNFYSKSNIFTKYHYF